MVTNSPILQTDGNVRGSNSLWPGLHWTELGYIPQDWKIRRIEEFGTVIRGASPRPKGDKRFYGGDVPRLMVEDVTRDGKYVTPKVDSLTREGALRSRPCPAGTLTLVCSGVVGVPSFLAVDACIHDGFLAIVSISESINSDYLYHQFQLMRQKFDASATHGGVFTNLTTKGVAAFKVATPPNVSEQEAISEVLDDTDAKIISLQHLLEKKRLIKKGAMQELLSGHRRLPGFGGDWALTRLGARGAFFKGSGVRRDQAQSGELPCIRYGELYTHFDNVIRTFFSRISPEVAASALKLNRGDILFAGSGETKEEIGKCAVLDAADSAYAGGDIVVFRARDDNPIFLAYYLNSTPLQTQKAAKGQGDAVVHISARALSDLELYLPSREEQEAIAETLLAMDRELEALDARLEKARQIKQGMMQELLTGRVRLV